MTDINTNLHGVLTNLTRNLDAVRNNIKQVNNAVSQLSPESMAQIKGLLATYEHPQSVSQFVAAVAQQEQLLKAEAEISTAVAVLQTAADDDAFQLQAQAQLTANETALNSPLPGAGQSGESAPAVAEAGSAPAAA